MMVGSIDFLDIDEIFDSDLYITFMLMSPTSLEPDRNGIFITERTNAFDCYTCDMKRLPVKIDYTSTYAFNIMIDMGLIDPFMYDGTVFRPVEKAIIHLNNGTELEFNYDKEIPRLLSQFSIED